MADTIKIKRGLFKELPNRLPLGEIVFCTDTRELYVGMGDLIPPKKASADIDTEEIGDINKLMTDDKSSLVNAINDLVKKVKYIEENGGMGGNNSAPIISSDFTKDTFATGEEIEIPYYVTDAEGGKLTAIYTINSVRTEQEISLGANNFKVGVLPKGQNTVRINVKDRGGLMSNELRFNLNVGSLELTSRFDDKEDFTLADHIVIPYEVFATSNEPVEIQQTIDGVTHNVNVPGNSKQKWEIGILSKGIHKVSLRAYDGKTYSNVLSYNVVVTDSNSLYVSSDYDKKTVTIEDYISIPYRISLQGQSKFKVLTTINGVAQPITTVNLGINMWSIGYLKEGAYTFTIQALTLDGSQESNVLSLDLNVTASDFDPIKPVEDETLVCYFDAKGKRNNQTDTRETWEDLSGNFTRAKLHNFNYAINGWMDDDWLKLNGEAYVEIDLKPFERNCPKGLTVDVLFKYKNIGSLGARILSCEDHIPPHNGLYIDTEESRLHGSGAINKSYMLDEEETRVTFVICRDRNHSYTYVNSVICDVNILSQLNAFTHNGKIYLGAKLGKDGTTIEGQGECQIKTFRVYDRALTHEEILQNYTADKIIAEQKKVVDRNSGRNIPEMHLDGDQTGMDKDTYVRLRCKYNSKGIYGTDFDLPACRTKWQGDSTLQYAVKNYDVRFENEDGSKFKPSMKPNWALQDRVWAKANMMESSGAYNIGISEFIAKCYKEKTPPMIAGHPATYSTEGFPMLMYTNDKFHGLYNWLQAPMGAYGLSFDAPYHYAFGCEENSSEGAGAFRKWDEASIYAEWSKFDDSDGYAFTHFQNVIKWLNESSDDEFKEQIGKRFKLSFLLDYYIFCYVFGMVDSLGKNLNMRAYGETVDIDGETHPVWFTMFFDMDSGLGFDNKGEQVWGSDVRCPEDYNTPTSLLWERVAKLLKPQLEERYLELRRTHLTTKGFFETFYDNIIGRVGEKFYNLDMFNKYLVYEEGYVQMAKGNKHNFLKKWIRDRLIYCDTQFNYTGDMREKIAIRNTKSGALTIKLKTYSPQLVTVSFGGTDSAEGAIQTKMVNEKDWTEFKYTYEGSFQKDLYISNAKHIKAIQGLDNMGVIMLDIQHAEKLIELSATNNPDLTRLNVANCKYLTKLDVANCTRLGEMININGCPNIKTLNAGKTSITGVIANECRYLNYINVGETQVTSLNFNDLEYLRTLIIDLCSKLGRVELLRCKNLQNIQITNSNILDTIQAEGCVSLENINVKGCNEITNLGIPKSPKLSRIETTTPKLQQTTLDLTLSNDITHVEVPNWSNLTTIILGDTDDLVYLGLSKTGITELDLHGAEVEVVAQDVPNLVEVSNGTLLTKRNTHLFKGCKNLEKFDATINITDTKNAHGIFEGCDKLNNIPKANYEDALVTQYMFSECPLENSVIDMDMPNNTNASNMFVNNKAKGIAKFNVPLNPNRPIYNTNTGVINNNMTYARNINLPLVKDVSWMFNNHPELLEVDNLNIPQATHLNSLFRGCSKLSSITNVSPITPTHMIEGFKDTKIKEFPSYINMSDVIQANDCFANTSIEGHLDVHYPKMDNCRQMFSNTKLTSVSVDLPKVPVASQGSFTNIFEKIPTLKEVHKFHAIGYNHQNDTNYDFSHMNPFWCYSRGDGYIPQIEIIRDVKFHEENTGIGDFFSGMPKLHTVDKVYSPNAYKNRSAFKDCTNLTSVKDVTLSSDPNKSFIGNQMFFNTPLLREIGMNHDCYPKDAQQMFQNSGITSIPTWLKFDNVEIGESMFYKSQLTEIRDLHLPMITNAKWMFSESPITIAENITMNLPANEYVSDLGTNGPFSKCDKLVSMKNINLGNALHVPTFRNNCLSLVEIDTLTVSKGRNFNNFIVNNPELTTVANLDLGTDFNDHDNVNITDYTSAFRNNPKLTTIKNLKVAPKIDTAYYMFGQNPSLATPFEELTEHINLHRCSDLSYFIAMTKLLPGNVDICMDSDIVTNIRSFCEGAESIQSFKFKGKIRDSVLQYIVRDCHALHTIDMDIDVTEDVNLASLVYGANRALKNFKFRLGEGKQFVTDVTHWCYALSNSPYLETVDIEGLSVPNMDFDKADNLTQIRTVKNLKQVLYKDSYVSLKLRDCDLSSSALNELFTSLMDVRQGVPNPNPTVEIIGCTGASTCNPSIAEAKGWKVIR